MFNRFNQLVIYFFAPAHLLNPIHSLIPYPVSCRRSPLESITHLSYTMLGWT